MVKVAENYGRDSRVKKTFMNVRVNLVFYFLSLFISFFTRKIFLDTLGADFMGLTGTIANILGFLNLAELGIGSAIGFLLYKPLYEHDEEKICDIVSVMGYMYRWIGFIILGAGFILACFMPMIFPDSKTSFSMSLILFTYFAYLASSMIGYFINYKATILGADQRQYVVTAYFQTSTMIKVIIQMVLAYYICNYYLWVSVEILFGWFNAAILNWKVRKTYPWLKVSVARGKKMFKKYPEVIKKTKQLFFHKIGSFIQWQTAPMLIYAFVSLETVAFYVNYTLIIDKIGSFLSNILNSTEAAVGNMIAQGDKKKIMSVYWELFSVRMFVAGFVAWSLFYLTPPFIGLWLGAQYLLPMNVLVILCVNQFVIYNRRCNDQFIAGMALWWDIWSPILESIIYLTASIIGGHFYGLPGVLFGPLFSLIIIHLIWKPILLYHWGFKMNVMIYWLSYLQYLLMTAVGPIIIYITNGFELFPTYVDSWFGWILYAFKVCGIYIAVTIVIFWILSRGMREFIKRFIPKFLKRH